VSSTPFARYAGLAGVVVVAAAAIFAIVHHAGGAAGVAPGHRLPPFAVPLALGALHGDANVATHAHQGSAGSVPACSVRAAEVVNVCQLYEHSPLVLALFVNGGSCADVLGEMQTVSRSYPGVSFAAVALEGDRGKLKRTLRQRGIKLPVGIDEDGVLASLYKVFSCPQLDFAYPGGVVQSKAVLGEPTLAQLRTRVGALVAASRARGWREPAV